MRHFTAAALMGLFLAGCGPSATQPSHQGGATFSASGAVYDGVGRPLDGASVEVVSGQTVGGSRAVTNASGRFVFEVVSGQLTVRASKPGYRTATRSYTSDDAGASREFWIRLDSESAPTLAGSYELTFTADPACAEMPLTLRTRTYSAQIARTTVEALSLAGAVFVQRGYPYNTVYLSQAGDYAKFSFEDPEILERVTPRSYLRISGSAEGVTNNSATELPLAGRFEYCPQQSGADYTNCPVPINACVSTRHTLALRRQ